MRVARRTGLSIFVMGMIVWSCQSETGGPLASDPPGPPLIPSPPQSPPPEEPTPPPPPASEFPAPETIVAVSYNQRYLQVTGADCVGARSLPSTAPLFYVHPLIAWFDGCISSLPSDVPMEPLLAPDGHQLTAGEWRASGEVTITCVEAGTRYDFRFEGLVPGGLYEIYQDGPTGWGDLASHPGEIRNEFVAQEGVTHFSVTGAEGPMTGGGYAPACALPLDSDEDTYFALIYMPDWVGQLDFHKEDEDA